MEKIFFPNNSKAIKLFIFIITFFLSINLICCYDCKSKTDLTDKTNIREYIEENYSDQAFLKILECKYGLRSGLLSCYVPGDVLPQYANHRKAAIYAFADYLSENM